VDATQPSLSKQREALCLQLQAQRVLIARQLDTGAAVPGEYPRSMTMRLLRQRPGMMVSLLAGLVALYRRS
jgi:hypothetical protein